MEQIRKILFITCLSLIAASLISCSDDFLSKNNDNLYTYSDTLFINYDQDNVETSIQLSASTTSDYSVFIQPKWLSFSSMHGRVNDGNLPLAFSIKKDWFTNDYQVYYSNLVLDVENFGMVSVVVAYVNLGSPTLQCTVSSINFLSDTPVSFNISNSSEGILLWKITGIPDWLDITTTSGSLSKGNSTSIMASLRLGNISSFQDLSGTIQILSNSITGNSFVIPIKVSAVAYTPSLYCSVDTINFKLSDNKIFTIKNAANGLLNWEITGTPDWLIISPVSGSLNSGNSTTITVSLNYFNINLDQDLSGTIQIKNNSPSGVLSIPVNVYSNNIIPTEVRQIGGIVTDAEFNNETGLMAICTKSPNSLIVYNTNTNASNTLLLDKTPNCISLSEDGHKAVIGYTVSSVSYLDIDNMVITRDYTIDCIPYDIVYGNNGLCYITPTIDQWVYMRNLNLNSGELKLGKNGNTVFEKTLIKKVHGKPYLVGTRTNLNPTGILIFDISRGILSDTITYFHTSIGKFWLSKDGSKLYDSFRYIFNLPEFDTGFPIGTPYLYGQIEAEYYYNVSAFDECPAIDRIFVAFTDSYSTSGNSTDIFEYNATNLNETNRFIVSPVIVTSDGINILYQTSAKFIFVNKEGSNLYVLKNLKESYNKDYWTIETFQL